MSIIDRSTCGRLVRIAAVAALALGSASVAVGADRAGDAWWADWQPKPAGKAVDGLAASTLDRDWRVATPITFADLPSAARADVGWMRREGFTFSVRRDLDRNGTIDHAVAGVFTDRSGRLGRFLLVSEQRGRRAVPIFLHAERDDRPFNVLVTRGTRLYWGRCMQCGDLEDLRLVDGQLALKPTD